MACVGPAGQRRAAWLRWLAVTDLEDEDPVAFPILPLAHRRADPDVVPAAVRAQLSSVYRQAWYRNRLVLRRARAAIDRLAESGIPVLLLKGAALASPQYYDDEGVRSISDVDFMVPRADARRAVHALVDDGWNLASDLRELDAWFVHHHAVDLVAGPMAAVDLHWDLLLDGRSDALDRAMWGRARSTVIDEREVLVPAPTDLLLHALTHGETTELRWMCDAATVIGTGAVDWELLAHDLAERRVLRLARERLDLLGVVVDGVVPADGRRHLWTRRCRWADRVTEAPVGGSSRRRALGNFVTHCVRRTRERSIGESAVVVVDLLRDRLEANDLRQFVRKASVALRQGPAQARGELV